MKGAVILSEEHFLDIMSVAWELLLEWNKEVVAAAASIFILAAVKCPQQVIELMQHGLTHPDTATRINSILRYKNKVPIRFINRNIRKRIVYKLKPS